MFAKIDVKRAPRHTPLYEYLKHEKKGSIRLRRDQVELYKVFWSAGMVKVVERFAPTTKPEDISGAIEKLL